MLFHITTRDAWQHAVAIGHYAPASLERDGFIHLSTEDQWRGVRERLYRDATDPCCSSSIASASTTCAEAADGDVFTSISRARISVDVEVRQMQER
jgi:hypothetical protein